MRQTRGFTAIELLVVIAIMVILAAVAVPSFSGMALEKRVRITATDISNYLNKIRTCGATSSSGGSRVVFDNKQQPAYMYGECSDDAGISRLQNFLPGMYDPQDPQNPQGRKLSKYSDVYISLLNAGAAQILFPRIGLPAANEQQKILIISDAANWAQARHCCRVAMNVLGVAQAQCSEFTCPQ